MSDKSKSQGGARKPERKQPVRDLPTRPERDAEDSVRGGKTPAAPSPIPMPYPN